MTHQTTLGWNPARTWVFVVGTLEWKRSDYFDSFPKQNRRDAALVECLRSLGVPAAQISYLQDRQATTKKIDEAFVTQLKAAKTGDFLILYYCGHGGKNDDGTAYFASYDTDCDANLGWIMNDVPATIEQHFGGSHALLMADCCYSGVLADAVKEHAKRIAFACLTSSLSSELSTGNWTFTEGVLAGLGGQAFTDADGNASISLGELAESMIDCMAFAEEQIATFVTTRGFEPGLILAAAKPRTDQRIGKNVAVSTSEGWYRARIIGIKGNQLKVHYYGYEESDDEWIETDRLRELTRPTYPLGATVSVKWKKKWFPATVKQVRAGIHYVEYEGFGPEWNEWVALDRIQPIA